MFLSKTIIRALPRSSSLFRQSCKVGAARGISSRPQDLDPNTMFDQVDGDHDGSITKEEFMAALDSMHYGELLQVHEAARSNLDALGKKLEMINLIEQHMADLEDVYEEKKDAYNNIGMTTASDIDVLFEKTRSKKDDIKDSLGELKGLVEEAKSIFASAADTKTN